MAEKSLYQEYLDKKYEPVVTSIVETLNGKEGDLRYYHKEMLTPRFSVNGLWESVSANYTRVSADFVALDSELPIKKRDSLGKMTGKIVKSGMELRLNEQQMQELDTMRSLNIDIKQILEKLFEDTAKCISGEYELMEGAFLEELSTGVCEIDDSENVGIGVRLDAGYLDENKFTPEVLWSDTEHSKPLDDIERVIDAAREKNRMLNYIFMDKRTWKLFRDSVQVREYMAGRKASIYIGGNGTNDILPKSTLAELNSTLKDDGTYGVEIVLIDRTVIKERNGVRTYTTPWQQGMVIFTESMNVGDLVWAYVAENNHKVDGVTYVNVENGILLSKFSTNQPTLAEFTRIQGRIVPVVNGAENIYQLDTTSAVTDSDNSDNKITINGSEHKKSDILTAITAVTGVTLPSDITDAALVALFNTWNKKTQDAVIDAIVDTPDPDNGGGS